MDTKRAKKLFFEFDGSRFYMSRNGVEDEYLQANVPAELEAQWLEQLTKTKLGDLSKPGNYWVLHFLLHHQDFRHFSIVTDAVPLGTLWQKSAFLEDLLDYIRQCQRPNPQQWILEATNRLLVHAHTLRGKARAKESVARIDRLIEESNVFRRRLETKAARQARPQGFEP